MYTFHVKNQRRLGYIMIAFVTVLIFACKEQPKAETRKDGFTAALNTKEDSLYHDVMQGHDLGMAKMSSLRKRFNHVTNALDSLKKLPAPQVDQTYIKKLMGLKEDLAYADEAMFKWMQEFNVDSAKSDKEKRLAYLESEKVKVEKVRDNILNSLQLADSLLRK